MAHSIAFAIVDDNSRDLQRLRHSVEAISGCTVMFAHTSPNQFFQQLVSTHQLPDVGRSAIFSFWVSLLFQKGWRYYP